MSTSLRTAARIILVGPPGSGKGTQTHRLLTHYSMSSISSGDLLRSNVRARTPLGLEAEKIMKTGGLLSDSIMVNLIVGELARRGWVERKGNLVSGIGVGLGGRHSSDSPGSSFLLDGFPRTEAQAKALEKEVDVNFVVNLDVPKEVILQRISERWVHEPSGRIYNTSYDPPKVPGRDDVTGEELTRRADDCPVSLR
jgi:adenylate kinase